LPPQSELPEHLPNLDAEPSHTTHRIAEYPEKTSEDQRPAGELCTECLREGQSQRVSP
jgi:hypothetical protein